MLITGVLQDGPASKGGLRPGDVVAAHRRRSRWPTRPQLLAAVAALKPQSKAQIGVQRGDQALDVTLTVAQRPQAVRGPER